MPGLAGLPPSFLSIDTDGRVLHLESLSKWICPGNLFTSTHHPPALLWGLEAWGVICELCGGCLWVWRRGCACSLRWVMTDSLPHHIWRARAAPGVADGAQGLRGGALPHVERADHPVPL